jgi:hypothetical protein
MYIYFMHVFKELLSLFRISTELGDERAGTGRRLLIEV